MKIGNQKLVSPNLTAARVKHLGVSFVMTLQSPTIAVVSWSSILLSLASNMSSQGRIHVFVEPIKDFYNFCDFRVVFVLF